MKIANTKVSQEKLRKLVSRVERVIGRHTSNVGVKSVATSLIPAAEAYAKAYDENVKAQSNQRSEMEQGREGVAELDRVLKSSLAILRLAVPAFDASELTATVETPDRLIVNAERVIGLLTQAGGNVPEGQALIEALRAAVTKAEKGWAEAQASRVELQQSQTTVRELAIAFNRELIALRRILRATVGTHHLDYQTLRASRMPPTEIENEEESVVEDDSVDTAADDAEVTNGAATHGSGAFAGTAA